MTTDKAPLDIFFLVVLGGSMAAIFICAGVGRFMAWLVNRGRK